MRGATAKCYEVKETNLFFDALFVTIQYGEKIISFREPPHCLNVVQFVVYCKQDFFTTIQLWHFVDYFSNTKKSNTTFFSCFILRTKNKLHWSNFSFRLAKKGTVKNLIFGLSLKSNYCQKQQLGEGSPYFTKVCSYFISFECYCHSAAAQNVHKCKKTFAPTTI